MTVLLPMGCFLLPVLRRPVLRVRALKISSSAAMAMSTCLLLEDVGRKKAQDSFAGAVDDDAALASSVRRRCLASSAELSSMPSIRPMPRTSVMQSWRLRVARAARWK